MSSEFRCETCNEMNESSDALARHLMNVHGVNRTRAYEQVGMAQPVAFELRDQERASAVIEEAARHLNQARGHARTLDGVASAILVLGILGAIVLVVTDIALLGVAVASALSTLTVWGVLRAMSLHLHMTVDQIMIEDDDDE